MRASSIVRSVAGGVVLAAALAVPTAAQGPPPGSLAPAGQKVEGRSYGQWEARYFQWIVRHHFGKSTSPESRCIASGQTEPVWFLASNTGPANARSMTCAVPAGRYLMVAAPNVECSTVERGRYHASTDSGLRRCARRQFDR